MKNVRRQSIFEDSVAFSYVPLAQDTSAHLRQYLARIDREKAGARLESIRNTMQRAAPQLPFVDVHLLEDAATVKRDYRPYRLDAALFAVFELLALTLAAIGIFGVVSYGVGQRTREIGVQIALGASRDRVARQVVRLGVAVTAIGVVIGAAIALGGAELIAPMLVDESPRGSGGVDRSGVGGCRDGGGGVVAAGEAGGEYGSGGGVARRVSELTKYIYRCSHKRISKYR